MNQDQHIYYRCPGKVLLLGGYAILNEENHGLSVAVDKYFYSYSRRKPHTTTIINFHSSNYQQSWSYQLQLNEVNLISEQQNQYFQAICKVIVQEGELFSKVQGFEVDVYLKADKEFYGQSLDQNKISSKTGLGSSSALIVVCLAALLGDYKIDVAMLANQIAQNKIGSGFDISTCFGGTQLYRRPKKNHLVPQKNEYIALKDKFELLMVDLGIGHDTISAVKGFQKYLDENEVIKNQFYTRSEELLQNLLLALQKDELEEIKRINYEYRILQQQFEQFEIEPRISTDIINQLTSEFDEIIYAVCPGAGGYDSIAVLVQKERSQQSKYEKLLKERFQQNPQLFQAGISEKGLQCLTCERIEDIMGELRSF